MVATTKKPSVPSERYRMAQVLACIVLDEALVEVEDIPCTRYNFKWRPIVVIPYRMTLMYTTLVAITPPFGGQPMRNDRVIDPFLRQTLVMTG